MTSSSAPPSSSSSGPCNVAYAGFDEYFFGAVPGAFGVGHFTVDMHPDVLVAFTDGTTQILPNNGAGVFTGMTPQAVGQIAVNNLVLADMNRDGRTDVVLGAVTLDTVTVVLQSAPGVLTVRNVQTGARVQGVAAVDMDGDQNTDLITSGLVTNQVHVFTLDNQGAVAAVAVEPVQAAGPILPLDVDSNGFKDLAVGEDRAMGRVVLVNNAGITRTQTILDLGLPSVRQLQVGDFSSDGRRRLAILSRAEPWLVLSTLSGAMTSVAVTFTPVAFAADDMDGNGQTDLVVLDNQSGVHLLRSGDDLDFTESLVATASGGAISVLTRDLNGDGFPDILVMNQTDQSLSVFLRHCAP